MLFLYHQVYGVDHSPWVQAVLLGLEVKGLSYSLFGAPGPETIRESSKQGIKSVITMPALWYNGACFFDSYIILRMLDDKHPEPPLFPEGGDDAEEDWAMIQQLFMYAPAFRLRGSKLLRFWYEWSVMEDQFEQPEPLAAAVSAAARPFVTLWMFSLINFSGMTKDWDQEIPKIFVPALQYFERRLAESSGPYIRGNSLSYVDLGLMGHFQCMLGNLSDEVIGHIDENSPGLWIWLKVCVAQPQQLGCLSSQF